MCVQLTGSRPMTALITSAAVAIWASVSCAVAAFAVPVASARPSDPGVVSYAILGKGSVGNIVGGPMRDESLFTQPFQGYFVDNPMCNNWADIGLPEVYNDPDLASFNGASTQTSSTGQTTPMHLDNGTMQVWSFDGGPAGAADAAWSKQEAGTDRRCFTQTRLRENVLLQAKVCQSGNGGPAVNVLAGAMQNALGQ